LEFIVHTVVAVCLNNVVVAIPLAVAAVAASFLGRRPAVAHLLWVLVLMKLVTPPLVGLGLADPLLTLREGSPPLQPEARPAASTSLVQPPLSAMPEPGPLFEPAVANGDLDSLAWFAPRLRQHGSVAPQQVETPACLPEAAAPSALSTSPSQEPFAAEFSVSSEGAGSFVFFDYSWHTWLMLLWLAGAAVWYGVALRRAWAFNALLKHGRNAAPELLDEVAALARRVGLSRPPSVQLLPGIFSPMVWAFGCRARLLLPQQLLPRLNTEQRAALLVHELAHLRRGDHWVRLLEFVIAGLYWWFPIVWLARRQLREAEELCCDAWVIAVLPGVSRHYAVALVETVEFISSAERSVPALAVGLGVARQLKRRVKMILQERTRQRLGWLGGLAVLLLGAGLLPLAPLWAAGAGDGDREEKPRLGPREDPSRNASERPDNPRPRPEEGRKPAERPEKPPFEKPRLEKPPFAKPRDASEAPSVQAEIDKLRREIEDLSAKLRAAEARLRELQVARFQPPDRPPPLVRKPIDGKPVERPMPLTRPSPADIERRLDELERKIDRLIQEIGKAPVKPPLKPRGERPDDDP